MMISSGNLLEWSFKMSDSSDTKVSYKLFAYKGIGGWGVITVPELISDKFYAFCVEKEWRYFQFR